MTMMSRLRRWWLACLGLALVLPTGCAYQTWVAGMTLPSGHYLDHPPQYFPPSPPFPLPRELAYQEKVWAAQPGEAINGAGLPAPVPPVVGPGAIPPGAVPPLP